MAIVIKKATSAEELQDVLAVRFKAVEETGRKPDGLFQLTNKITDHIDAYPDTFNIIAYQDGDAVAALRGSVYHAEDEYLTGIYDFREATTKIEGPFFTIDMLAVTFECAARQNFFEGLLKTMIAILARNKARYGLFLCPQHLSKEANELGFNEIGEPFKSNILETEVIPSIANIPAAHDRITGAIKDQEMLRFQETFYRVLYDAGEIIMAEGERGNNAIIVESGKIAVVSKANDSVSRLVTLGSGALVGEMGLMTNEPRSVSIIAETTTSCLAFDRENFLAILYQHPNRMLDLFQIPAKRLKDLNKELMKARQAAG